jgi:hypothetical protein
MAQPSKACDSIGLSTRHQFSGLRGPFFRSLDDFVPIIKFTDRLALLLQRVIRNGSERGTR